MIVKQYVKTFKDFTIITHYSYIMRRTLHRSLSKIVFTYNFIIFSFLHKDKNIKGIKNVFSCNIDILTNLCYHILEVYL